MGELDTQRESALMWLKSLDVRDFIKEITLNDYWLDMFENPESYFTWASSEEQANWYRECHRDNE
ncbi:hypothetical protein LS71_008285 [Helicobacter jaachi]|uniref:Uncharacterized protein n=1 Tax=Helicobacter jaachi TaxID=1677920 RepID=A0A4U8T768_9HELI|nr:hypothetical protein [Helicobacter jaachi]TLD95395.1 hypothetical protein LS71_008285 [Helicobacter jaachi]